MIKTLIIAILTLTHGGSIEIQAPSLEQCEEWAALVGSGVAITEFGMPEETVIAIECRPTEVLTPEAEGEDV